MCQVLSSPASQAVNSPRRHVSHPTIPYHVLPPGILPVEYSQQLLVQPGEYLHLPQPFGLSFSQSAGLGFLGDFAFFDAFGLSFAVALAGDLRAADGLFLTAAPLASCSAWSACMDCNGLKGGAGRREVERSTPLLWGRGGKLEPSSPFALPTSAQVSLPPGLRFCRLQEHFAVARPPVPSSVIPHMHGVLFVPLFPFAFVQTHDK